MLDGFGSLGLGSSGLDSIPDTKGSYPAES